LPAKLVVRIKGADLFAHRAGLFIAAAIGALGGATRWTAIAGVVGCARRI